MRIHALMEFPGAAREAASIVRRESDVRRDEGCYRLMKKLMIKPSERNCPECMGAGFTMVDHPTRVGVKIYRECKECRGKGRVAARKVRLARPSLYLQISSRFLAAVADDIVAHLGTFIEAAKASLFDGRDVYEHVFATTIGLNKAKALLAVEPLHRTCRHVRTPF